MLSTSAMVSVKKVDASMFEEVYPLIQEFDRAQLSKTSWENIFSTHWEKEEDYCGYALMDGNKVVGFLGLIFSQRLLKGKIEKFCNLHTWFVKKEYRAYSMYLMMPVVRMKNYTVTDLSSTGKVYEIIQKLGFSDLETKIRIILPLNRFSNKMKNGKVHFLHEGPQILAQLNEQEKKIFRDHQAYPCHHLLIKSDMGSCYIVYSTPEDANIPCAYIQYLSNRDFFIQNSQAICQMIAQKSTSKLVLIDQRMVGKARIPFSVVSPFNLTRLYKSSRLRPEEIDNLYSETILLNFAGIPSFRRMKKDVFSKLLG